MGERADCGILLDVNNIYVSAQNHGFNPYDYLRNIPFHRVAQIHPLGILNLINIFWIHMTALLRMTFGIFIKETIKLIGITNTLLNGTLTFSFTHTEALKANKVFQQLELLLFRSA